MARNAGKRRITIETPAGFSFHRTALSHGWFDLAPFHWDHRASRLVRTLVLPRAGAATARIVTRRRPAGSPGSLVVEMACRRDPGREDLTHAARGIARILRLDESLEGFYATADTVEEPDLRWTAGAGAGRLMRAPTVFEDLVKMICTTNCTWALTRVMISALVTRLGEEAPDGFRTFPAPEVMAGASPRFYRDVVRAGYRGPFLRDLAAAVAGGDLDLEAWLDPSRPTGEIRREILSVKGAGRYVADNMLKLLGRYDGLGIDTWCRRKFSEMYHGGRKVTDRRIERFYGRFGPWRGLALWCDVTKDWFDAGNPLLPVGDGLA